MSEAEDRSYYEISLSNSQVLVAFVVLLACVLGAFVSGMWVAREAIGPPADPAATARPGNGETGETLEFFGDEAPAQTGDGSSAASTSASASGADPEVPDPEVPDPEVRVQQVKPLPDAATRDAAPVDSSRTRREETRAAAEPTAPVVDADRREPVPAAEGPGEAPEPDTDRREAAAAPAAGAGFVIQVFSSIDEAQADALLGRLRASGYSAFRSAERVDGRTVYRVRVGPYPERSTAETEAAKLKREFKVETWITSSG